MKYMILHGLSEYSGAYFVDEFATYEEALEKYQELSTCYYTQELKFLKIDELKMAFIEEVEE